MKQVFVIAGFAAALCAPGANANAQEALQWSVTPYLWASDTTVDLTIRDTNIGGDDISFDDLLDVLDAAFMVHVEAGRGNWSAFLDITYLSTSDTTERPLATIDGDSEQTIIDAAVTYWPGGRLLRRFARRALHVRAIGPMVDRHAWRPEFRGFGRNVPVASQLCVLSGQAKAEQHFVRLPVQERGVQRRRRKDGLHVRRSDGRLQLSFLGAAIGGALGGAAAASSK
ncbi:MAG: hypothetical protein P8X94_09215 [Woeseiaceae bacterium]